MLGALAAIFIMLKLAPYYEIKKDKIFDLSFYLIIGGIIGARIYHIFLELPYYLNHPLDIFKIWQGGLAIHGGIIAGIIIIYFFAKRTPLPPLIRGVSDKALSESPLDKGGWGVKNFWLLTALIVPGLALAQAIGRWGNYFNQELFGLPTNKPWGIPIDIINRPADFITSQYFHPTFLYESLGNFLIFLILIFIHIWIIKKFKQKIVNCQLLIVNCYLILYSLLRFSLEFIRLDTTPEFLGLRFPQIVSLIIIFLAPTLLLLPKIKNNANIK
jgi:phosphatidylglycerol:prolipoprotein diacylglycerol transferase